MFTCVFLMTLVVLPSCFADSYEGIRRSPCYGDNFTTDWTDMGIKPTKLTMFFTPSRPGRPRRKVSDNGVASDPRYALTDDAFNVRGVTEKDDGQFSALLDGVSTDVLRLLIRDCSGQEVDLIYGAAHDLKVRADVHTLDFAPQWHWDDPPLLLWNRTGNPQAAAERHRGRLLGDRWAMERLTQENSGYYTFRREDRELAYRDKITVHAPQLYFFALSGEEFSFAWEGVPGETDMSYTPYWGYEKPLMERGWMVTGWERVFEGRMSATTGLGLLELSVWDLRTYDTGVFLLRDQRGNVALKVSLDVPGSPVSWDIYMGVGVAVAVLLLLVVVCCVCVRKHRKNQRSTKTNAVPLTEAAAAGAVSFSDVDTTRPSTSAQPASSSSRGPTYPREPASTEHHPLVDASSSSAPRRPAAASSDDALSSGGGVQFELKGIPSAPPDCNVYTSDKLNFPSYSSSSSSSRPTEPPRSAVYQPLAPGPVESSPAPGGLPVVVQATGPAVESSLPVFIHPTTHF